MSYGRNGVYYTRAQKVHQKILRYPTGYTTTIVINVAVPLFPILKNIFTTLKL